MIEGAAGNHPFRWMRTQILHLPSMTSQSLYQLTRGDAVYQYILTTIAIAVEVVPGLIPCDSWLSEITTIMIAKHSQPPIGP